MNVMRITEPNPKNEQTQSNREGALLSTQILRV